MDWGFIFTLFAIMFAFIILWIIWPSSIGAIFVPTPHNIVGKMLELAEVKEGDLLYDLGSGDGRIIIEAADKYKADAVGIEADPLRVFWSRIIIRYRELGDKIKVVWGNFFRTDLSEATVVTVYQGQGINNKLVEKFEKELKPGTRIISYTFTFDRWEPIKKVSASQIYLYKIPE